jgi:hypothetical protein
VRGFDDRVNQVATIELGAATVVRAVLAQWSVAPTTTKLAGYFCRPIGRVPRRCEPCSTPHLFGYFRARTDGTLPALPKWRDSAVRFSKLPPWQHPRRAISVNVSDASVIRSRLRADQAVPRPADAEPVWTRPPEEPVDFLTQWDMFFDAEFQDKAHPTVALQRRVYGEQERAEIARASGAFSQIKYEAGPFWSGRVGFLEERAAHHWRYIDRRTIPVPTESDLTSAFSRMLGWSADINQKIKRLCNAKAKVCRAYQAGAVIRDCYLYGLRISAMDIIYADRVVEAVHEHLRRDGRIDWTSRTAILDMLEGATDRATAEKFGLHHKSLQERYADETADIEAKFGRYCSEIWQPRQNRSTSWYTGVVGKKSTPAADRVLTAAERKVLVDEYYGLASGPMLRPMASDDHVQWLRDAYRRIAEYLELGGRILAGDCDLVAGLPEFIVDRRSDAQVLEAGFTGSRYRDVGLEPFRTARAERPLSRNIEYGVDVGLRHGLADDAVPGTDDDDQGVSPFLQNGNTLSPED